MSLQTRLAEYIAETVITVGFAEFDVSYIHRESRGDVVIYPRTSTEVNGFLLAYIHLSESVQHIIHYVGDVSVNKRIAEFQIAIAKDDQGEEIPLNVYLYI